MAKEYLLRIKQVNIWRSKPVLSLVLTGLVANLVVWTVYYFRIEPSVYPIPLHFNIYTGIDTIDFWYKIFMIPGFGSFLWLVNTLIGLILYPRDKFITYLLLCGNLLVQAVLLTAGFVLTQRI